jgi:putative hydrolase of the HAD superfamily
MADMGRRSALRRTAATGKTGTSHVATLSSVSRLWVFDGDDTLWFVEPLYDRAREAAAAVVAGAGLDPQLWEAHERAIDVANVEIFGVSPDRFPTSCVQAYETLARESDRAADPLVAKKIRAAAEGVFEMVAPSHPAARDVVALLRQHGVAVLLTKGDDLVQRRRIEEATLTDAFDEIRVVAEKTDESFTSVLSDHGVTASDAWSIGNSLRSDINPALRVGMHAIWVDAHVWEYERAETEVSGGDVRIARDLAEVPGIVFHVDDAAR